MQTIGQLADQLIVNAIKVAKYEAMQPRSEEVARRLETLKRQHVELERELEANTILVLFGLRAHRTFRQAKCYGGKLA